MRSRKFLITSVVVSVIGFLLGYFVVMRFLPTTGLKPPSLDEPAVAGSAEPDVAGWCCNVIGQKCTPAPSAQLCIGKGGRLFNRERTQCDTFCAVLKGKL
jgi:hypothetical protein